jgi:hypothetical protein
MIVRKDSMGHVDLSLCLTIFVLSEAEVGGDIWYWILKMSIFHLDLETSIPLNGKSRFISDNRH